MKKTTLICLGALLVAVLMLTACGGSAAQPKVVAVKSVTLAESLNSSYQAVNPKTQFKATDTIYVSVDISGRPTTGTINGKFYFGDQLISEATMDLASVNQGVIFSIGEDTFAGFNLVPSQPWPVGTGYHFDLYLNGAKTGSYPYAVIQ